LQTSQDVDDPFYGVTTAALGLFLLEIIISSIAKVSLKYLQIE